MAAEALLEKRTERFRALCDRYGLDLEPTSSGGTAADEDARLYLDPDDTDNVLRRWAYVTHSGEITYVQCAATQAEAQEKAIANTADLLYAEAPGRVVDLDAGTEYMPAWSSLQWRAV
jgi:hypothetical protein